MATKDPIDIGAAFSYATSDPDWMKKTAVAGLHLLIPVLGMVAIFGWTRDIFWRVRRGEEGLPDMELGRHIGEGWAPLVALFNVSLLALLFVLPVMCAGGLIAVAEESGSEGVEILATLVMLVTNLLVFVFAIGVNVLVPEIWRRGFHGEMGPIFSLGDSFRRIKGNGMPLFLVIIGFFVAQMVGSIGVMACYIGMIVTLPFSYVVMAHLIAQWDALVNPEADPAPAGDDDWELASKPTGS